MSRQGLNPGSGWLRLWYELRQNPTRPKDLRAVVSDKFFYAEQVVDPAAAGFMDFVVDPDRDFAFAPL